MPTPKIGNWKYITTVANNPKDKKAAISRAAELNFDDKSSQYAVRKNPTTKNYEIWARVRYAKKDVFQ
jgi:hypothetical protein